VKEYLTVLVCMKCNNTASSGNSEKYTDVTLFSTVMLSFTNVNI